MEGGPSGRRSQGGPWEREALLLFAAALNSLGNCPPAVRGVGRGGQVGPVGRVGLGPRRPRSCVSWVLVAGSSLRALLLCVRGRREHLGRHELRATSREPEVGQEIGRVGPVGRIGRGAGSTSVCCASSYALRITHYAPHLRLSVFICGWSFFSAPSAWGLLFRGRRRGRGRGRGRGREGLTGRAAAARRRARA